MFCPIVDASSPHQRQVLLNYVVAPELGPDNQVPILFADILRAVYITAQRHFAQYDPQTWRRQYQLSLVAQGVRLAASENLSPDVRWWCYRLAGYAGRRLLSPHLTPPTDAPIVHNPFHRESIGQSAVDSPWRREYSDRSKLEYCRRLADDWSEVASVLQVPQYDQERFPWGRQANAIWEWLENRGRLHELAVALRRADRSDLADTLDGNQDLLP